MSDFLYKVQSRFLFHAHIRIKIPAAFDEAVFDELFAVLERVDRLYNSYRAGSFMVAMTEGFPLIRQSV